MIIRTTLPTVLTMMLIACSASSSLRPAEMPTESTIPLPTELSYTSVLARAPMQDTARVAGTTRAVEVVGVLNQTAPCFELSSFATRAGSRVVVRLTATERPGTCATFAAGAFDYTAGAAGLGPGGYDVDVVHRVVFKDGRVAEARVGGKRVEVR